MVIKQVINLNTDFIDKFPFIKISKILPEALHLVLDVAL